jgi:hypothetical protein
MKKIMIMKKIFSIPLFLGLIMLVSCQKQLELTPKKIYYDNFYQSAEDAISAVNAVYSNLNQVNQYNSSLWLLQDVASDDCFARENLNDPNIHQIDQYDLNATNNYLSEIWRGSYQGIFRANIVLEKVPETKMDTVLKNRILGEARFLRGQFYFNLVRLFGDVPLITKPISSSLNDDELYVARTSVDLVYNQVIEDFIFASSNCPKNYSQSVDKGRVTKGAALGLLSKTYLTLKQWTNAANTAKAVVELGVYGLYDDYSGNFKDVNRNGKESVFAVQFFSGVPSQNNQIVITGLPSIPGLFPAGVEVMLPTENLLNSFEEGDYRKEVSFFDEYWFYEFEPHIWKHWDQDTYEPDETAQCGSNFAVMRYSEILLIYAEAINEISGPTAEAYDAINQIRNRARNGNAEVLPDLDGLSQDDFRLAVLNERRHEFVNEGVRWYDLVRTGNLVEYVNNAKGSDSNPQEFNNLFPIPQRELDNNPKLDQNLGYQ